MSFSRIVVQPNIIFPKMQWAEQTPLLNVSGKRHSAQRRFVKMTFGWTTIRGNDVRLNNDSEKCRSALWNFANSTILSNAFRSFFFGKTKIRKNCISAKRRFDEMFRENDVAPFGNSKRIGVDGPIQRKSGIMCHMIQILVWILDIVASDSDITILHLTDTATLLHRLYHDYNQVYIFFQHYYKVNWLCRANSTLPLSSQLFYHPFFFHIFFVPLAFFSPFWHTHTDELP